MRYLAMTLALLALALVCGCTAKPAEAPPPEPAPDEPAEAVGPPKTAELVFDTFAGGGPEFTAVIGDPGLLSVSRSSAANSPEPMPGMGYTVYFTITGLRAGTTTLTIEERSPIADNLDHIYTATVDEALNVTLEHVETRDLFAQMQGGGA